MSIEGDSDERPYGNAGPCPYYRDEKKPTGMSPYRAFSLLIVTFDNHRSHSHHQCDLRQTYDLG